MSSGSGESASSQRVSCATATEGSSDGRRKLTGRTVNALGGLRSMDTSLEATAP